MSLQRVRLGTAQSDEDRQCLVVELLRLCEVPLGLGHFAERLQSPRLFELGSAGEHRLLREREFGPGGGRFAGRAERAPEFDPRAGDVVGVTLAVEQIPRLPERAAARLAPRRPESTAYGRTSPPT